MTSRRREKKKAKKHVEEEENDRLSDLPDSLLLHILSFLPETKFAVRTCVLSQRWKCLWTSLPDLIFDGHGESFNKLVRRVLSGRNNLPVNKICFAFCADKSLITRIINYSASHDVQHLNMSISASLRTFLSNFNRCRFRCLKTLELGSCKELQLLRDISLPSLTTLHLSSCSFSAVHDDELSLISVSIDPFINLINLTSLQLDWCRFENGVRNFKISGPQLHSLTIDRGYCSLSFDFAKIEIFAPKLHSFNFLDAKPSPIAFSNFDFPLLEIAYVDVCSSLPYINERYEKFHLNLINVFQGLYHAQSLYVSSNVIKVLMEFPDVVEAQASPFVRLKTLNLISKSNSFSISDVVMNYFLSGSTSGKEIRIKTLENNRYYP